MEKLARDKEEKYAEEIKAIDRKKELTARVQQIVEDEKKVRGSAKWLRFEFAKS